MMMMMMMMIIINEQNVLLWLVRGCVCSFASVYIMQRAYRAPKSGYSLKPVHLPPINVSAGFTQLQTCQP